MGPGGGRSRWLCGVAVALACGRTAKDTNHDTSSGGASSTHTAGQSTSKPSVGGAYTGKGGVAMTQPDGEAGAPVAMGGWLQGVGGVPLVEGGSGGQGSAGGNGDEPWSSAGATWEEPCAISEVALIPLTDRRDVVIDDVRCRLYVSTTSGVVYAYDLKSKELAPFVDLETELHGMDLSPGRGSLLVASGLESPETDDTNAVHVVNVETKATRTYRFPLEPLESSTFMPLFISNQRFLLTSSLSGSGGAPLRTVSLADGSFEVLDYVGPKTMLTMSANGNTVAYAEPTTFNGSFTRWSLNEGSLTKGQTDWFAYEIAISRDATQLAVPAYGGLFVFEYDDSAFGAPTNLGEHATRPGLGVAYSPDQDLLYTSMAGSSEAIEAYDSTTLELAFTLDASPGLAWPGFVALASGRLRISRNGEILAATVDTGVKVYPARAPR